MSSDNKQIHFFFKTKSPFDGEVLTHGRELEGFATIEWHS